MLQSMAVICSLSVDVHAPCCYPAGGFHTSEHTLPMYSPSANVNKFNLVNCLGIPLANGFKVIYIVFRS